MKSILREVDTNWHKSIYYYSRLPGCEDCDTRVLTVIVKMEVCIQCQMRVMNSHLLSSEKQQAMPFKRSCPP